jgi:CheY-like chemotaxis protein
MANDIILVVDDEQANRSLLAQILGASGFDATIAHDGFDALLRVAEYSPRLMISDLQMPRMSGFELLSVVRRRFPEIAVICMSGFYDPAILPPCVICDAFFAKGAYKPSELLAKVTELLSGEHRAALVNSTPVPIWLPRGQDDYYIVTCTSCLRSFPVRGTTEVENAEQQIPCLHCQTVLTYFIEGRRVA